MQKDEVKAKPVPKNLVKSDEKTPSSASMKTNSIKFEYTNDSALECVLQSPLAQYVESVKDSNWKVRLEGSYALF